MSNPHGHEFDSSRTCNYCGAAAERVFKETKRIPEDVTCPKRIESRVSSAMKPTPEERASNVLCDAAGMSHRILLQEVAREIRDAVTEEREACALWAERYIDYVSYGKSSVPQLIANGIRACGGVENRGEPCPTK